MLYLEFTDKYDTFSKSIHLNTTSLFRPVQGLLDTGTEYTVSYY